MKRTPYKTFAVNVETVMLGYLAHRDGVAEDVEIIFGHGVFLDSFLPHIGQ
jgi:hypothetical protein